MFKSQKFKYLFNRYLFLQVASIFIFVLAEYIVLDFIKPHTSHYFLFKLLIQGLCIIVASVKWLLHKTIDLHFKSGFLEKYISKDALWLLPSLLLLATVIFWQHNLPRALGTLEELSRVNEVESKKEASFFTIKNFEVDFDTIGWFSDDYVVDGRHSSTRHLENYTVFPLPEQQSNIDLNKVKVWYGKKVSTSFNASRDEEYAYQQTLKLIDESIDSMFNTVTIKPTYFERIRDIDDLEGYHLAVQDVLKKECPADAVILRARYENLEENRILWTTVCVVSFFASLFIYFLLLKFLNVYEADQY